MDGEPLVMGEGGSRDIVTTPRAPRTIADLRSAFIMRHLVAKTYAHARTIEMLVTSSPTHAPGCRTS